MKIALGENRIAQSASPTFTPNNKIYAASVVAANMVAFAEKTLGWMLVSTPKDTEGFFHREFTEGAEDWRRVVVPATECPRFTPEQLASEKATLGARKFAQEFLYEFVSTNEGMFNQEWFEECGANSLSHTRS